MSDPHAKLAYCWDCTWELMSLPDGWPQLIKAHVINNEHTVSVKYNWEVTARPEDYNE